jgi:predicted oxidoreductase (fatty acid repression mutant protein)
MKFTLQLLFVFLLVALSFAATQEQKPVIVSYPKDTPQSVLDEAIEAIKKAVSAGKSRTAMNLNADNNTQGGVITHEYGAPTLVLVPPFATHADHFPRASGIA